MKKKRLILLTALLLSLILLFTAGSASLVYVNRHNIYLFIQREGLFLQRVPVKEKAITDLHAVSIEEAQKDDRVTFDQSMMLINKEHMLTEDFSPALSEYKESGVLMNDCMQQAYASLSAAVSKKTDTKLYVSSHYRTPEKQAALYLEDPNTATVPGASEHQTGLCVDVYVAYYAGDAFIKSPAGRFVNSNCHDYGFIIRYPSYGEKETGIRFEPWHIRYVGFPHASIIHQNHLTLEEYLFSLEEGRWYLADGYLISRQPIGDTILLPEDFSKAVISEDNTGCCVVTVQP